MKRTATFILFLMSLNNGVFAQANDAKMNAFISGLMKKMTIEEKIGQLNLPTIGVDVTGPILSQGVEEKIKNGSVGGVFNTHGPAAVRKLQDMAVKESRLKIPLFFGMDIIHGHTTIFPIALALSCSWDMELIERSAKIAAEESTADGLNWTFSPMVDIARDPRWGRIAEGAGEDPYLGSLVAKAMVRGYQGKGLSNIKSIMACVKHFGLYGAAEGGRDYNTVDMSPVKMYEYYLPPYKAAVEAGVASVMTSFNEINGVPSTGNKWLLTDLLRDQWGFKGFVVTDYTAINEMQEHGMGNQEKVSELAINAGVDMDMVSEAFLTNLKKLLLQKRITMQQIDLGCRRILEAKYKLGLFDDPYKNINDQKAKDQIFTADNRKASREIAEHSFVLLKNAGQLLPLKRSGTIALIGPLADDRRDMIGPQSAAGDWKRSVSLMDALKQEKNVQLLYSKGANISEDPLLVKRLNLDGGEIIMETRSPQQLIDDAVKVAVKADVIVAVLGESQGMTGEASSRSDIGLPENQLTLLKALVSTGKPVVLLLMNGRPLTLEWESKNAAAILETWFAGTEAGNAITNVLFGDYNPSGKLTTTFPYSVGQIPIYYNHKNTGRPFAGDQLDKYKSRYLDAPNDPLYPFGFGLSYTSFSYSEILLNRSSITPSENLTATVKVANTGDYDGEETIQLYINELSASITQPVKKLKAFQKIFLKKGESKEVKFILTADDLRFYNSDLKYVYEPGEFKVFIGDNSRDVKTAGFTLTK